jgi:Flp pilus assembly protein TadD
MRHMSIAMLGLIGAVGFGGCNRPQSDAEVKRAIKSVNVIDESNLSDVMLTVGDPNEAVTYFARSLKDNPDRVDLKRGLAKSLVRAGKSTEAASVWADLANSAQGGPEDRVGLADALIRSNEWPRAEAELARIPPTYETFERYRLEAMVADSRKNWKKADSFYETAVGLTAQPANVLNNWGYSKLTRGDNGGAERLFLQALTYDPNLFTAKNNLVLARAGQGKYDLPVITMTQVERAELLYTAGLAAVKQGKPSIGRQLLQDSVDTHPQHFEAAARSLAALDG